MDTRAGTAEETGADSAPLAGPLSGLLVLDLTHVLNGPFGTMMLADLGARVIKIEPPGGGDDTRTYGPFLGDTSLYFAFVNRGKESIVLDLKAEADRAVFLDMVCRADVLAENFRPGVMARLGFAYEDLARINPRLVYASSSGFGQTGPLAAAPAYDTIIQAMSGLMSMTGFPDGPPTRVGTSLSDLLGGLHMFAGIAAALYARERTGRGTHVDVSMFDATLAFLEHGAMEFTATGHALGRIGNRHPFLAPFDLYACADGHIAICCGNDHLFGALCAVLGRPELSTDPRFRDNSSRVAHVDALKAELETELGRRPAQHWLEAIHAAGVPVGPLLDVTQALSQPQVSARNMLVEAGGITMPGTPFKMAGYPDPHVRAGAPGLDADGARLRREFAGRGKTP
ncbi:CoA:oxalate CoA-transferase [Ancylobacter mangrovi]|uniref:CoA:oxalate CoA-transferase n=1 Tax=Ancylobacter mangrovi TaxID=2972472 RepID=UPI00216302D1|nr:CoA:oxalate CoA-transferase [Ancylobacter mangrovi]MCS0501026.1 CoA:oxalate CoA-transferase [Ancylobacter mangrovi]